MRLLDLYCGAVLLDDARPIDGSSQGQLIVMVGTGS